ncbi:hypothetical protein ACWCQS_05425 [Streptomyces sp. NPDC002076]
MTDVDVGGGDEGIPFGIRHSGGYYVAVDTQGPRITALRLLDEPPPVTARAPRPTKARS